MHIMLSDMTKCLLCCCSRRKKENFCNAKFLSLFSCRHSCTTFVFEYLLLSPRIHYWESGKGLPINISNAYFNHLSLLCALMFIFAFTVLGFENYTKITNPDHCNEFDMIAVYCNKSNNVLDTHFMLPSHVDLKRVSSSNYTSTELLVLKAFVISSCFL